MKEIIIVGAGGFGRELLQWIKDINETNERWVIKGFIDDNLKALEDYECDYNVLGKISNWKIGENEVFACAIANPGIKEKVVKFLKRKGAKFDFVIHPKAITGSFNKIGEGIVIYPGARLTVNIRIGSFVTILSAGIGHDVQIGDFSTISSQCNINGKVKLGEKVFMGSNSTVVPDRTIGDNVYIGAGSIVIRNIKSNTNSSVKVFGNPAKIIDI
jgi:sugar O-acyltransferase (sialic acid O-acetyltransferase NeuD family)